MEYPGLSIDIEKMSQGIYQMIKEHPDGACLRLGMVPADIMEAVASSLAGRIPDIYIDKDTLDEVDGKAIREDIEHLVYCKVLELASKEGVLLV